MGKINVTVHMGYGNQCVRDASDHSRIRHPCTSDTRLSVVGTTRIDMIMNQRVSALESSGSGVTVNGVLPSTIDTPANRASMSKSNPSSWTKPASIVETLIILVSNGARQIGGASIPVGSRSGVTP